MNNPSTHAGGNLADLLADLQRDRRRTAAMVLRIRDQHHSPHGGDHAGQQLLSAAIKDLEDLDARLFTIRQELAGRSDE